MKLGALIQARMSSRRLPGKVLSLIGNKPILEYTLERLRKVDGLDLLVVCTSTEKSDDPIVSFCCSKGAEIFRGPLANVALRFRDALLYYGFDYFLRICADSPFIDQNIVVSLINALQAKDADIFTNVYPRSFPKGQSVELIKSRTFVDCYSHFDPEKDYEHVTTFFYRYADNFRIHNVAAEKNLSDHELQVDTARDLAIAEELVLQFTKPHWEYGWQELLKLKNLMTYPQGQQLKDA